MNSDQSPMPVKSAIRDPKSTIILFLLLFAAACGKIQEKPPVKIATDIWPGYAHALLAQELGLFKKNRVEVQLIMNENISVSSEMFKNGEVDGLFQTLADIIVLNSQGFRSKIVYVADYSDAGDVIIGRPEFSTLKDLKGKIVSFEGINSFSHVFVLEALEKAGLRELDIKFENLPAMDVLDALEKGKIDAGHTWEPIKSRAVNKGYKILGKAGDMQGLITDILAFGSEILQERPDDIQRIIKSLFEAKEFIKANREKAVTIMAKATGMSTSEMEEGLKGAHACEVEDNLAAMRPSEELASLSSSGKIISEFLLNRGQLNRMPDMEAIVEPGFIKAIAGKQ